MNSKVKKQLDDFVKRYNGNGYEYVGKWNGYKIYSPLISRKLTIAFTILGVKNDILEVFKNDIAEKVAKEMIRE